MSDPIKKRKFKKAKKPRARGGLISSTLYLADQLSGKQNEEINIIESTETTKTDEILEGGLMNVHSGTSDGLLDMGKSHHLEANLAEAMMGNENLGAKTTLLSASAHCEYGLNNSAGINASLVRAEGNLGPIKVGMGLQCDCSASIGVNGVEASVLGTGFSVGPKVGIKTPFMDFSVKLF